LKRLGLLVLLACDQTAEIGSRYAAQQMVSAAQGGAVAAPAGDELAGASLQLPPGALPADALVTLDRGAGPLILDPPPAGPVVVFTPVVALQRPATVTLPLRLGPGQSAADVMVLTSDPGGQLTKIDHSLLSIEVDRVRFATPHLGPFEPAAVLHCIQVCPNGWTCLNGECHP